MTDFGDNSFLKVETGTIDQAMQAETMDRLHNGQLDAVLIDGLFSKDECARIVTTLEANVSGFEKTDFPGPFQSFFYGRNLNLDAPDLTDYFAAARRFETALCAFSDHVGVDVQGRIASTLSGLDHGRPFVPAPGPSGESHFFTTFRGHHPGGYIPAHFDNEQSLRPSYVHVDACTRGSILSFVVTLAEAESGGVIELFDLCSDQAAGRIRNDDNALSRPDLGALRSQRLHVPAGGIAIVNSGRRLHRVVPVGGSRIRWTICSFMARSRDGNRTFCWG